MQTLCDYDPILMDLFQPSLSQQRSFQLTPRYVSINATLLAIRVDMDDKILTIMII